MGADVPAVPVPGRVLVAGRHRGHRRLDLVRSRSSSLCAESGRLLLLGHSAFHLTEEFYDPHLDNAVRYARHAMSIDENRADFDRVGWGSTANLGPARKQSDPDWLQQVWFAGNHSDVGGSYPENEARLSDISLEWMAHAAENLPDEMTSTGFGIKLNRQFLQLRPDPAGPQHDAREPGYFWGRLRWKLGSREIRPDAVLHSSVYKRFAAEKVQHYYEAKAYRPENLSKHGKLQQYYRQGLQGPSASAQGAFAPTI